MWSGAEPNVTGCHRDWATSGKVETRNTPSVNGSSRRFIIPSLWPWAGDAAHMIIALVTEHFSDLQNDPATDRGSVSHQSQHHQHRDHGYDAGADRRGTKAKVVGDVSHGVCG